jgi:hypothetical protein
MWCAGDCQNPAPTKELSYLGGDPSRNGVDRRVGGLDNSSQCIVKSFGAVEASVKMGGLSARQRSGEGVEQQQSEGAGSKCRTFRAVSFGFRGCFQIKIMCGFQNKSLDVRTQNGLDDTLIEPLEYLSRDGTRYCAPKGSTTDGVSTPKIVRMLPGYDATGDDWWSGVLHDSAYRNFLQKKLEDGTWAKADLSQAEADRLILEAMAAQRVGWFRRHVIYIGLRFFGWRAFEEDRRKHDPQTPQRISTLPEEAKGEIDEKKLAVIKDAAEKAFDIERDRTDYRSHRRREDGDGCGRIRSAISW